MQLYCIQVDSSVPYLTCNSIYLLSNYLYGIYLYDTLCWTYLADLGQWASVVQLPLELRQEEGVGVDCGGITHSSKRHIELLGISLPLYIDLQTHKRSKVKVKSFNVQKHSKQRF